VTIESREERRRKTMMKTIGSREERRKTIRNRGSGKNDREIPTPLTSA
jgi:hypothetical protein